MSPFVLTGEALRHTRGEEVGGKTHGLASLCNGHVPTPEIIAVTAHAFRQHLHSSGLNTRIGELLDPNGNINHAAVSQLTAALERTPLSNELAQAMQSALGSLPRNGEDLRLAVRSSATHEDLRGTSFAGIYRSLLNVSENELSQAVARCYASLYSHQSLRYMRSHDIDPQDAAMAVLIQPLVPAAASGTLFTADPDTLFSHLMRIDGAWGFGEGVVAGRVTPDSWTLFKSRGIIIERRCGQAREHYIEAASGGLELAPITDKTGLLCLSDEDVLQLYAWGAQLEKNAGMPLDIEWVKARDGRLLLLQARPLSVPEPQPFTQFQVQGADAAEVLASGFPLTQQVQHGRAVRLEQLSGELPDDAIVVADMLDPETVFRVEHARGLVVKHGGPTSHLSILLREQAMPALLEAQGTEQVAHGEEVTLSCLGDRGVLYRGAVPFETQAVDPAAIAPVNHPLLLVTSALNGLDQLLRLPVDGIGLVRLERVIADRIGVHPQALLDYDAGRCEDAELRAAIASKLRHGQRAVDLYVDGLTEGIAAFAARCPDRRVNVRLPDLSSDNQLGLLGAPPGDSTETNPMLGFRGVGRLVHPSQRAMLEMDLEALRRVVDELGFSNLHALVPFCRTPAEGATITKLVRQHGPKRAMPLGMMAEIPSNLALGHHFAELFDFFLVGPMDLTQLVYGADRMCDYTAEYCQETEAVKELVKLFLSKIAGAGKDVFIGGWPLFQHAAEYHEVNRDNRLCLVELPDRILQLFKHVRKLEQRL